MSKKEVKNQIHPWRKCPLGEHWRNPQNQGSYIRNGKPVVGSHHRSTCVKNSSKKDQIYKSELEWIATTYFMDLSGPPKNDSLSFPKGNNFDHLIRGWTKYWNEVLIPKDSLDPNLIKALIASESSFEEKVKVKAGKKIGWARGLMQITDGTLKILSDEKGELKNHLVNIYQKDMDNPNLNIAGGIRWVFRKKETASARLKKEATWDEAVAEYKGYLSAMIKKPGEVPDGMIKFQEFYLRLKDK